MAVEKQSVETRVKNVIAVQFEHAVEKITLDVTLDKTGLGIDSLDLVELVMAVEEEFGIDVPDEEADRLETVGDLIALIHKLTGE